MADYEERISAILRELGAPTPSNAQIFREATELVSIGLDIYNRDQRLAPPAAEAWRALKDSAQNEGETLQLVSAFRSVEYQTQIIQRKLSAGKTWEEILRVSALPGYSEHHTGRTVDITTPHFEPLTEDFERSSAFNWLTRCAHQFGFTMTYPRGNKFGIAYEPWHWTCKSL